MISNWKPFGLHGLYKNITLSLCWFNPFKPEFIIVIFIHCKPRIAVAILDLQRINMTWSGWQKIILFLLKQFHEIKSFLSAAKGCFDALRGFMRIMLGHHLTSVVFARKHHLFIYFVIHVLDFQTMSFWADLLPGCYERKPAFPCDNFIINIPADLQCFTIVICDRFSIFLAKL